MGGAGGRVTYIILFFGELIRCFSLYCKRVPRHRETLTGVCGSQKFEITLTALLSEPGLDKQ